MEKAKIWANEQVLIAEFTKHNHSPLWSQRSQFRGNMIVLVFGNLSESCWVVNYHCIPQTICLCFTFFCMLCEKKKLLFKIPNLRFQCANVSFGPLQLLINLNDQHPLIRISSVFNIAPLSMVSAPTYSNFLLPNCMNMCRL